MELDLARRGLSDVVLNPRWVLTDENDGKRSESNPLELLAGARLIIPGYKDPALGGGELRSDAPTERETRSTCCAALWRAVAGRLPALTCVQPSGKETRMFRESYTCGLLILLEDLVWVYRTAASAGS